MGMCIWLPLICTTQLIITQGELTGMQRIHCISVVVLDHPFLGYLIRECVLPTMVPFYLMM